MLHLPESLPVLGIALILAVIVGKLAHFIKIPQVTGYILVGLILGPTFFNLLTVQLADSFHLLNELAFGLILFNIGGEFHRSLLRKMAWKHVKFSVAFALGIFVIVFGICFFFSLFSNLSFAQRFICCLFLGIIAIAAAPPTTLLVLKEFESEGPLTQSVLVYLAVGTVIAIMGAHAATFFAQDVGVWKGDSGSLQVQIRMLLWSVAGSALVGILLGWGLSFWEQKEKVTSEMLLAVICAIMLGQTLAFYLHLEPLLISLMIGFSVVNSSRAGQAIHASVKGVGLSIYALFFVLAGAHIHIQEQIKTIGILGLGYLIARIVGMIYGARFAAKVTKEDPVVGKYMGLAVLSHAGAAIAIVTKFKGETDSSATAIATVVLGSVFVFEIIGPLALQYCLTKIGEARGRTTLGKVTSRATLSLWEIVQNFFRNMGPPRITEYQQMQTIGPLVNHNVLAINKGANLDEVIDFIGHNQLPLYPVVDMDYKFEGVIQINSLKEALSDPTRFSNAKALNLIGSRLCIKENGLLEEAIQAFATPGMEALPVVHSQSLKLVGILSYKDVVIGKQKQG